MLLQGCFLLRNALEFIDKIVQAISAQITVGFWLHSAHEDKNEEPKPYRLSAEEEAELAAIQAALAGA